MIDVWTLVFINIMFNVNSGYQEPIIEGYWKYDTMMECFEARSILGFEYTGNPGHFPKGTQAVCIHQLMEPA